MKSEGIIFSGPGQIEFGEVEVADPEDGDAVVRTIATVVSTGTDTRVLRGGLEAKTYPLVPGYSSVGVVERIVGDPRAPVGEGDLVFAGSPRGLVGIGRVWGAQVRHCVKPASSLVVLDERNSPEEYAFSKVAAIALHGVRRSGSLPGDRVVVIGQGLIGLLHGRIQAAWGRVVAVADLLPWRLERARAGGVAYAIDSVEQHVVSAVREIWPEGVPVAVEASASQPGINDCVELLRERTWNSDERMPVLMLQGTYPEPIRIDAMTLFRKEYVLINSRDNDPRDLVAAARMIGSGALRVDDLITLRSAPQDAATAFQELLDHPERHLTIVFNWE